MGNSIRWYMDEMVASAVTAGLRLHQIDVQTTGEAGMLSALDPQQLDYAKANGRVFFTQDAGFLAMHSAGVSHLGIVYAPMARPIGVIIRELVLITRVLDAAAMINHVEYV